MPIIISALALAQCAFAIVAGVTVRPAICISIKLVTSISGCNQQIPLLRPQPRGALAWGLYYSRHTYLLHPRSNLMEIANWIQIHGFSYLAVDSFKH